MPEPSLISGSTLAELSGDWNVELNGKQLTTPLKSWEELATPSFAGPAIYRRQFTSVAPPAGKRAYLEIADVRDYARVKLNGKELGAHAWQPYRWEVTAALKAGNNDLEIQVNATPAGNAGGRGRGGAPPISGLLGPVRLVAY
jgi:ABC-type Fe3+ transport system substrate-binding protein